MRCFHTFGTYRYHYREHFEDISIPIPCDIYITRRKKRQWKKENKNRNKTIMHSVSTPRRDGTRLVFGGGTVSPMMCPSDGQQKDDKKGQTRDKARRGQRQGAKARRRMQQGSRFSLKLFFPGVLWWSVLYRMIYRNRWWYHIQFHVIWHNDIPRYRIHIPNLGEWYGDIASSRTIFRYRIIIRTPNSAERGWGQKHLEGTSPPQRKVDRP